MNQLQIPEGMASFFNTRVSGYEDHMKENPNYHEEKLLLAKQFDFTDGPVRILDLGCGTGLEIEYILEKAPNARFLGIDLAGDMLESIKSKYKDFLNQIELVKASYFDYDFERNQYDYVVACSTMHHWLPEQKLLIYKRIFNSLKPGGKFINDDYLVPEAEAKAMLAKYLQMKDSGVLKDGEFYHIDIPCSVKTESQILNDAGFRSVKIVYEHYNEKHNGALLVGFRDL